MSERLNKSNRAPADYFEVLVCQYIANKYKVPFRYAKELAELSNKTLDLPDGERKLRLQNSNVLKITGDLKKIIESEVVKKGKVIAVTWIGRNLVIESTADINTEHASKKLTRFSVKSIAKSGLGTIKNLGMRKILKYLHIDFRPQYQIMWQELRDFTGESDISRRKLKEMVLASDSWLRWATNNGTKYQKRLNALCLRAFNKLPSKEKIDLVNFVLDASDKDLYVIIANSDGAIVYQPRDEKLGIKPTMLAKGGESNVGYTIFINGVATYRVQTNNTNGRGISAFCQRFFFVDSKKNY